MDDVALLADHSLVPLSTDGVSTIRLFYEVCSACNVVKRSVIVSAVLYSAISRQSVPTNEFVC